MATVSVLRSTAGLLVGIAIVVVVYVLVQFVAIGRLPTLATSTRALADPLVSSGAVLAFALMGSFAGSAAISTAIRLAYAATSAALLTFRRRARAGLAPFVAPFGAFAAVASLALMDP